MDWTLDKSRPISQQLCEKLCVAIAAGIFAPGERLLSVREVALAAGVNPNTVQKSFEELERRGVVHSIPYSGWYVNEYTGAAQKEVNALQRKHSEDYLQLMAQLGCSHAETLAYLQTLCKERNGETE